MAGYLLTCNCGRTLPVETGQAGGQIQCPCGATLSVPPLRQLRQLPPAVSPPREGVSPSHWSAVHGAIAACLLAAALLTGAAGWSRWSEPATPSFDPVERNRFMHEQVDQLTPVEGWWAWVDVVRPLAETGFRQVNWGPSPPVQQQIDRARFFQAMMVTLAAVCLVVAAALAVSRKALRAPRV